MARHLKHPRLGGDLVFRPLLILAATLAIGAPTLCFGAGPPERPSRKELRQKLGLKQFYRKHGLKGFFRDPHPSHIRRLLSKIKSGDARSALGLTANDQLDLTPVASLRAVLKSLRGASMGDWYYPDLRLCLAAAFVQRHANHLTFKEVWSLAREVDPRGDGARNLLVYRAFARSRTKGPEFDRVRISKYRDAVSLSGEVDREGQRAFLNLLDQLKRGEVEVPLQPARHGHLKLPLLYEVPEMIEILGHTDAKLRQGQALSVVEHRRKGITPWQLLKMVDLLAPAERLEVVRRYARTRQDKLSADHQGQLSQMEALLAAPGQQTAARLGALFIAELKQELADTRRALAEANQRTAKANWQASQQGGSLIGDAVIAAGLFAAFSD
jgi:hypothetical protein